MDLSSGSTTHSSTWRLKTVAGPSIYKSADVIFGTACFLCFLVGTLGNIVSFLYFKSKKRDISSVIYMFITANDMMVSLTALPVAISFWSERRPGIFLGDKYGCIAWNASWRVSVPFSVFLVLCLSITRTFSLVKPFAKQKIRYLIGAIVVYLALTVTSIIILQSFEDISVKFNQYSCRCDMFIVTYPTDPKRGHHFALFVSKNIIYIPPAFVVAASCIISIIELTRRNRKARQRELQQSRNRATVTILLFALLYGVCNIPLVLISIMKTIAWIKDVENWYGKWVPFDKSPYYYFATYCVLLITANSAANPILYFWRMSRLREFTLAGVRRFVGVLRT